MNCVRDDATARFILTSVLKVGFSDPFFGFVIVGNRGFPVGAFTLNNHSGANVELTICCDVPLGIRAARFIAKLCFIDLKARRVTVHTRTDNRLAQAAIKKAGFSFEGYCRDFYEDGDAYSYSILARSQRLIRIEP